MPATAHIAEPPPSPGPPHGQAAAPVFCRITYQMIGRGLAHKPDPAIDPRAPAIAPAPTRILRLLGVLRALITFGNHLAATLNASPGAETVRNITRRFGAFDIAVILARITRGLQLAQALEAKFAPQADRPDPAPRAAASAPRQPRNPRNPITPKPALPQNDASAILAALPTAQQIAQQLRVRPVHDVLIDICNDLGICPADPLWHDIDRVLMDYNGSFLRLWKDQQKRFSAAIRSLIPPNVRFVWPTLPSVSDLALAHAERAATGPP